MILKYKKAQTIYLDIKEIKHVDIPTLFPELYKEIQNYFLAVTHYGCEKPFGRIERFETDPEFPGEVQIHPEGLVIMNELPLDEKFSKGLEELSKDYNFKLTLPSWVYKNNNESQ